MMQSKKLEVESWKWKFDTTGEVQLFWNQNGFTYPDHVHEDFNLDYIQSGQLEYRISGRTYLVDESSIVSIDPHEVHSARVVHSVRPAIASLFISEDFLEKVLPGARTSIPKVLNCPELSLSMVGIYEAVHHFSNLLEVEIRVIELLARLYSRYPSDCVRLEEKGDHKAVKLVQDYLRQRFSENVRLNELADLVHLSKPYLVQLFRETVGLPPYRYLMQIRLEKARKLLIEGLRPAEVAAAVGFSDQSHLIRFFKRGTGVTPITFVKEQYSSGGEAS